MNPSSSYFDIDEYLDEEEEDFIQEPEYAGITESWLRKAIQILSKVAELNSHKKFKAAVKIQSYFRGWLVRKKILTWNQSAIKIQKIWRGFLGRYRYFQILEDTLQSRIIEHYNNSAVKIQSTFRGYYSRKYYHNHIKLKQLQLKATSELLTCVALTTRKLYKNQQIPGIYSLRNSKCLIKVEKLLALLQIKTYNEEVKKHRAAEVLKLNNAFKKSIQYKNRVLIPFGNCKMQK